MAARGDAICLPCPPLRGPFPAPRSPIYSAQLPAIMLTRTWLIQALGPAVMTLNKITKISQRWNDRIMGQSVFGHNDAASLPRALGEDRGRRGWKGLEAVSRNLGLPGKIWGTRKMSQKWCVGRGHLAVSLLHSGFISISVTYNTSIK